MGRKRLLTILAAVTAAVGLQVGTASAQTISLPGVGDITLEAGECLEVGVDISLADALKLDPSVCVNDDGVKVEGGASAGDQKIDAGEVTEPVQEATKKVAETVKGAETTTPAPSPTTSPSPKPSEPQKGGTSGGDGGDDGGTSSSEGRTSDGGSAASPDVAASGDAAERAATRDRDRDSVRQLGALRAIRSDMAAGGPPTMAGPVQPFGGLSTTDDLAAPQVADAEGIVPGVDERLAPQVAPAPDQQEAVLATSSPLRGIPEAPVALQLLAAALVLGAATVWTIASRELGSGTTTHA